MTGHVFIYGDIGQNRGEVSFDNVRQQLSLPENKAADEIILHIISNGGEVFQGEAIYNALKNSGKKITTHIEGTCASIATLIAAAGERIIMNKTARFMIHNPKIAGIQTTLESKDLRDVANQLDQIKTLLINVYDKRTTLGKPKLWELYDNTTWLTADEAQQMGFVDESVDAIQAVAKVDFKQLKMKESKNLRQRFIEAFNLVINKVTNSFTETLADGRAVIVESEDENWTGKMITLETGEPLPAGSYPLKSGKVLTVDANSTITQITEAPTPGTDNEMEDKIKQLEAQLAEAKLAKETAEATAAAKLTEAQTAQQTAENRALKIEAKLTEFEKQFMEMKEQMLKTVGTAPDAGKGPVIKNATDKVVDPMLEMMGADLGDAWLTSRPSHFKLKSNG